MCHSTVSVHTFCEESVGLTPIFYVSGIVHVRCQTGISRDRCLLKQASLFHAKMCHLSVFRSYIHAKSLKTMYCATAKTTPPPRRSRAARSFAVDQGLHL
jgi:hypothetical protein